jgi:leucyl aminopeptidase
VEGVPQYFREIAEKFAAEYKVDITVISGDDLLKEGFRLLHAVGRASKNEPVFVNLSYRGNPTSEDWIAFVGKGVCFDSGGLDIKSGNF